MSLLSCRSQVVRGVLFDKPDRLTLSVVRYYTLSEGVRRPNSQGASDWQELDWSDATTHHRSLRICRPFSTPPGSFLGLPWLGGLPVMIVDPRRENCTTRNFDDVVRVTFVAC